MTKDVHNIAASIRANVDVFARSGSDEAISILKEQNEIASLPDGRSQ